MQLLILLQMRFSVKFESRWREAPWSACAKRRFLGLADAMRDFEKAALRARTPKRFALV
jgi:hypothetical protein